MNCNFVSYCDIGGRENNEDCVFAGKIGEGFLFAVADGLGGHDCGEIASDMAITAVKDYLEFPPNDIYISDAINDANNRIIKYQAKTSRQMRTTLCVAYICGDSVILAHVGDSRIYLLRDNKIIFQSHDHSVPQTAVDAGEISPSDIRKHPDRNKLTRALGISSDLKIDISKFKTDEFDCMLICSDGFWEHILEEDIEKLSADADDVKDWLESMTGHIAEKRPVDCDNCSAIAVQMCK